MVQQLTLYSNIACPFAQRAEIALEEAGFDYVRHEIDLQNKPEWYISKVNPLGKVPALAVGGPKVDSASPSAESKKLAESLVLVDFVNDLSNGSLLPIDPIERADVRFFISQVSDVLVPAFVAVLYKQNADAVLPAIEKLQALLPAEGYAAGQQYTEADIAAAPFLARLKVALKIIAKYTPASLDTLNALEQDPKFARFAKYYDDLTSRESFKRTWKEDIVRARIEGRIATLVEQSKTV